MKIQEFEGLKLGEIKKVEKAANKYSGRTDCRVTGYSATKDNDGLWYNVQCEICFDYEVRADFDIMLAVCMFDRRRSFAAVWDCHIVQNAPQMLTTVKINKEEKNMQKSTMQRKSYTNPETKAFHGATTSAAVAMKWYREGKPVTVHGYRADGTPYSVEIPGGALLEESYQKNRGHCKCIAKDIDDYVSGNVKRCPDCGKVICRDWNDVGDKFKCPDCGTISDIDDLEDQSISDYLDDVYNIEFRTRGHGPDDYCSVQLMIACGGPNIYLDTEAKLVELYWMEGRASYPLSSGAVEALDDWAEEYWRGM